MKSLYRCVLVVALALPLSGCLFTKVVSVPMRLGGAVVSVIPGPGDAMHSAIDGAATTVDALPF